MKRSSAYGGLSSVGRASDCGSECRGFEPHIPPKTAEIPFGIAAFFFSFLLYKQAFKAYFCDKNAPSSQTELCQTAEIV